MGRPGLDGVERLRRKLEKARKAGQMAARQVVPQEAERLAARMRMVVPVEEGDLRESITVTPEGERTPSYSYPGGSHTVPAGAAEITAGNKGVRYAHLVEYGTQTAAAQPFFWPVIRAERKRTKSRIQRAIRKAMKEAAS